MCSALEALALVLTAVLAFFALRYLYRRMHRHAHHHHHHSTPAPSYLSSVIQSYGEIYAAVQLAQGHVVTDGSDTTYNALAAALSAAQRRESIGQIGDSLSGAYDGLQALVASLNGSEPDSSVITSVAKGVLAIENDKSVIESAVDAVMSVF